MNNAVTLRLAIWPTDASRANPAGKGIRGKPDGRRSARSEDGPKEGTTSTGSRAIGVMPKTGSIRSAEYPANTFIFLGGDLLSIQPSDREPFPLAL